MHVDKPVRHRIFRKNLVTQLVGNVRNSQNRKRGRPSSGDEEFRLNNKFHALFRLPDGKSRECRVCSDRKAGGRKETITFCKTCPKQPALHIGECFEKYHTLKKYK